MDKKLAEKFESYPDFVKSQMYALRELIIETAVDCDKFEAFEESLKWGEPSFVTQYGSPIRIDWKSKRANEYAMYFHCQTKLVDTFKELYGENLKLEGNRAMIFTVDAVIPKKELKHCISLAFDYHRLKHLPLLGA
ncbi:DUF1801 domain-containing protein [Aliikangiella marina]|uniref:DUF1801 domain-containing protein n=1 Tax=Aliikangiella marina TaxID=1712262 RepID=A0A545TK09_9GAMM|nr:DUF1801 domain-containing protein [Aliikangiella marina]